jgi:hypothetical protein
VAGAKASAGRPVRSFLRRRAVASARRSIPTQEKERRRPGVGREAHRRCDRAGRLINRLKQFRRRLATRHEERAANHAALLTIAMSLLRL